MTLPTTLYNDLCSDNSGLSDIRQPSSVAKNAVVIFSGLLPEAKDVAVRASSFVNLIGFQDPTASSHGHLASSNNRTPQSSCLSHRASTIKPRQHGGVPFPETSAIGLRIWLSVVLSSQSSSNHCCLKPMEGPQ
jgi:hypothetical protein